MDEPELLTVDAFLTRWAADRPDHPALRGEHTLSWSELDRCTRQVAAALQAAGLAPGDRIAWLGKNAVLYFVLLFGAARAGVVLAPVGWRLATPERHYILQDSEARLLFAGPGFEADALALAPTLPRLQQVLSADAAWAWIGAQASATATPPRACDPDEDVLQLYTSGTTGHPKGVALSNRNLFGLRRAAVQAELPWAFWDAGEVVMVAMPCAHIGGTGLGVMALSGGVCAAVLAEFTPDGVFDAIAQQGVTRFFAVPAALQMLVNHPRASQTDFSRLKYIFYGAAPIPLALLRQCVQVFGCEFAQAYGMTETTGTVVLLPPADHDPAGSPRMRAAGKPVPGVELKVVDGDGQALPPGQVGEVVVRSVSNMRAYWRLPEATARTRSADGWVATGDAGYLDNDGYLYIHDRMKDMIISGGENIYPTEVENAIYGHPDVADVAVIGVPDTAWGEAVKAICVAKPGHTVEPASIIAWARERIAGYKLPKTVDVIAELPRNPTGKVLRRALRAPYWDGRERQVN